jgi:hypothetical protein
MDEQRIILPPRATAFRVVCTACQETQLASRGYVGAAVDGLLPLDDEHGTVVCPRGHVIDVVRETPAAALR